MANPGDKIAIRAGTYNHSGTYKSAGLAILRTPTNGTNGNTIDVFAWAGRAVIDFSAASPADGAYAFFADADYWTFTDLDFTGLSTDVSNFMNTVGSEGQSTTTQTWTRCRSYGNTGSGFYFHGCTNIVMEACDSFENVGPGSGGDCDGFAFVACGTGCRWGSSDREDPTIGCRAWANSDDGFDCWDTVNPITINGCWSFRNGYASDGTTPAGDGNGFKLGRSLSGTTGHTVKRNLAFKNRNNGFDENGSTMVHAVEQNAAGENGGSNYSFGLSVAHELTNNLSYAPGVADDIHATVDETTNSWQFGTAIAGYFTSVDSSAADDDRAADGTLPTLNYLKPSATSIFINRGTDIGDAYNNEAPDIGWFEGSTAGTNPLPPTWTLVGVSTTAADVSGNFNINLPAGIQSGDALLCGIAYRGNAQVTGHADWTKVANTEQNTGNTAIDSTGIAGCAMFHVNRGGSDPGVAFTRTGGDILLATTIALRPSAGTVSVDASGSSVAGAATTNPSMAAIASTVAGTVGVWMLAGGDNFAVVPRYTATGISENDGSEGTANPPTDAFEIWRSSNNTNGADTHQSLVGTYLPVPKSVAVSISSTTTIPSALHAMAGVILKAT